MNFEFFLGRTLKFPLVIRIGDPRRCLNSGSQAVISNFRRGNARMNVKLELWRELKLGNAVSATI